MPEAGSFCDQGPSNRVTLGLALLIFGGSALVGLVGFAFCHSSRRFVDSKWVGGFASLNIFNRGCFFSPKHLNCLSGVPTAHQPRLNEPQADSKMFLETHCTDTGFSQGSGSRLAPGRELLGKLPRSVGPGLAPAKADSSFGPTAGEFCFSFGTKDIPASFVNPLLTVSPLQTTAPVRCRAGASPRPRPAPGGPDVFTLLDAAKRHRRLCEAAHDPVSHFKMGQWRKLGKVGRFILMFLFSKLLVKGHPRRVRHGGLCAISIHSRKSS